jgi:sporulation protein YlmC with PRC-barrel domain
MQSSNQSHAAAGSNRNSDMTSDNFGTQEDTTTGEHLVASDDVVGTSVSGANGDTIGSVEKIMIDKKSGRVAYAVMNFGGFMGLGQSHYPIPWSMLRYDPDAEAYQVDLTEEQLHDAPTLDASNTSSWQDRQYGSRIHDYYGATPYWTM